jgi:heptosyltransferase-1
MNSSAGVHPSPSNLHPAQRLLAVRLSALGDVIHTIPAVVSLKEHFDVTWVVEAPYRELVEIVAGVGSVPVRIRRWHRQPSGMRDALQQMRGFDAAVDFQGLIKSSVLPWVARAKVRYGFAANAIREKPALWFLNRKVPVDTSRHVIEQNLELASAAIASAPLTRPASRDTLSPQAGREDSMGAISQSLLPSARGEGGPAKTGPDEGSEARWSDFAVPMPGYEGSVVLLPGAGKPAKLWPVERFRELAQRIGPRALAAWGPGERELAEAIGARMAPPTNLRELAGILRSAEVVIGADTGPLHLAAALGTKVVGLYGPTDPRRNGPYGQLERVIDRFSSTKSMESISVEEVMNRIQRVAVE